MTDLRPWLRTWDVAAEPAPEPTLPTLSAVKREARRQRDVARAEGRKRALPVIYEALAQAAGYPSWTTYRAALCRERTP